MMESMVIFHRCRSLAATDAFYIQQLGLTLWHTQPGCHIYDSGYGYLGFVEAADFELPAYSCISFNCTDCAEVDRLYEKFKGMKGITAPRRHPQFAVYSFFIQDPDGYTVEFQKIVTEGEQ